MHPLLNSWPSNQNHPSNINAVLIYRPPKPHPSFTAEIHDLLTSLCSLSSNNIILGGMNIHSENPSSPLAADFLNVLDCLNLTQHVDAPTHSITLLFAASWIHMPPSRTVSFSELCKMKTAGCTIERPGGTPAGLQRPSECLHSGP